VLRKYSIIWTSKIKGESPTFGGSFPQKGVWMKNCCQIVVVFHSELPSRR